MARLHEIKRQQDPGLKAVVERLSEGEVRAAVGRLEAQGRVHAIAEPDDRLRAVATAYVANPAGTLVVAPDNQSREQLNTCIRPRCSQELTADRVLLDIDSEQAGERLVNQRLAYVALSRGRHDAQIYSDDRERLSAVLSRDVSKSSAHAVATAEQTATDRPRVTPSLDRQRRSIGREAHQHRARANPW